MSADPWEPTRDFFAALDELRGREPNPKMYRLKDPCLFPLLDGRRCCECETCQPAHPASAGAQPEEVA